jgi:hypothetical protein
MTTRGLAREVEMDEDIIERRRPGAERTLDRVRQRLGILEDVRVRGLQPHRAIETRGAEQRQRRGPHSIEDRFERRERAQASFGLGKERIGHVSAHLLRQIRSARPRVRRPGSPHFAREKSASNPREAQACSHFSAAHQNDVKRLAALGQAPAVCEHPFSACDFLVVVACGAGPEALYLRSPPRAGEDAPRKAAGSGRNVLGTEF